MLLDMSRMLSGATDTLPFSYTLSANRIPYSDEVAETAIPEDKDTGSQTAGAGKTASDDPVSNEEDVGDYLPLVFDDVTVTAPVVVSGNVVNRAGYMVLTEEAVISYRTRCARCLTDVEERVTFRVEKTVADEKGLLRLENRDNDDYVQISGGKLDLDAPICDEILLSFPMRVLCSEDCKGLCSGCGANLNEEACRCTKKEINPAFASLASLLAEMDDDDEDANG